MNRDNNAVERSLNEVAQRLVCLEAVVVHNGELIERTRAEIADGFRAEVIVERALAAAGGAPEPPRHPHDKRWPPYLRPVQVLAIPVLAALTMLTSTGQLAHANERPVGGMLVTAAVGHAPRVPGCLDHDPGDWRLKLAPGRAVRCDDDT